MARVTEISWFSPHSLDTDVARLKNGRVFLGTYFFHAFFSMLYEVRCLQTLYQLPFEIIMILGLDLFCRIWVCALARSGAGASLVLRCQRRCVYVLFIQPSQTDTVRPPGPCYGPDRQLKGDFSTHLGLGNLLGSHRDRLGRKKWNGLRAMFWPENVMSSMFVLKPALWAKLNLPQKRLEPSVLSTDCITLLGTTLYTPYHQNWVWCFVFCKEHVCLQRKKWAANFVQPPQISFLRCWWEKAEKRADFMFPIEVPFSVKHFLASSCSSPPM